MGLPQTNQGATDLGLRSNLRRELSCAGFDQFSLLRFRRRNLLEVTWNEVPPRINAGATKRELLKPDPIAVLALDSSRPLVWSSLDKQAFKTPGLTDYLNIAPELGLHDGVTFPIHGANWACDVLHISRSSPSFAPLDEQALWDLFAATSVICARLRLFRPHKLEPGGAILTDRERQILQLSKDGNSYAEISSVLGISSKTVEFHMANVMRKLGVSQKISAIITALRLGLIEL